MEKYAIYAHVTHTNIAGYSNKDTVGVGRMSESIIRELNSVFQGNIANLKNAKVNDIRYRLKYAADKLSENGICFFYFHGHGDSKPGIGLTNTL